MSLYTKKIPVTIKASGTPSVLFLTSISMVIVVIIVVDRCQPEGRGFESRSS